MIALLLTWAAVAAEPWTLAEALATAQRTHPTVAIAEARIDQARATRGIAWSAFGPDVTATGTYARRPGEVTTNVGQGQAVLQARDALRATGRADLTVVDLSAIQSIAAANTGVAAQELASEDLVRTLGFEVADAYLTVLAVERLVAAAERRTEAAAELVRAAEARLTAGLVTRNAVTRTALEQSTADLAVVEARGQLATARVRLAVLLGVDTVEDLVPAELALDARPRPIPAVEALELRAREARQEARATNLGYLPALGLYGTTTSTNEAGFTGRTNDWSAGALATWTLFDGGFRLASASRLRAVGRELDATADELALQYREALETARADLATAQAALALAESRAIVADENLREVHARFAAGLATALEVSDASASAFEAEAGVARQALEVDRALLRLADAMGLNAEELL